MDLIYFCSNQPKRSFSLNRVSDGSKGLYEKWEVYLSPLPFSLGWVILICTAVPKKLPEWLQSPLTSTETHQGTTKSCSSSENWHDKPNKYDTHCLTVIQSDNFLQCLDHKILNIYSVSTGFCVCVLIAQSCLTLCDPMNCSPPDFSVHGILQARILEWVAIPFSGDLPDPGIEPTSLHCRQILHHWTTEKPWATF